MPLPQRTQAATPQYRRLTGLLRCCPIPTQHEGVRGWTIPRGVLKAGRIRLGLCAIFSLGAFPPCLAAHVPVPYLNEKPAHRALSGLSRNPLILNGAEEWIRTTDLLITNRAE